MNNFIKELKNLFNFECVLEWFKKRESICLLNELPHSKIDIYLDDITWLITQLTTDNKIKIKIKSSNKYIGSLNKRHFIRSSKLSDNTSFRLRTWHPPGIIHSHKDQSQNLLQLGSNNCSYYKHSRLGTCCLRRVLDSFR